MSIAPQFCPPESEGVCEKCNRWSAYCITRWSGVIAKQFCRRCRS